MNKESKFWEWFKVNEPKYYYFESLQDENSREYLLNEFMIRLHEYCDKLYFQLGSASDDTQRELIISAEGNTQYFEEVEKLILAAPKLKDWSMIAFKPPLGTDFEIEYEDLKINVRKLWFLPLENDTAKRLLGLQICFENYDAKRKEKYLSAAYQILDTALGEKSNSLDVNFVEVGEIPRNPEENGLIEINDLSDYIKWWKTKI